MTQIICPYIFPEEIEALKSVLGWELDYIFEEDLSKIGSDLMYQKLWKQCPEEDIFILHADMMPVELQDNKWFNDILKYVEQYPEAGMFGCKLMYPIVDKKYIQCAGGYFDENLIPQHYGSGVDIFSGQTFKQPETDNGQYDNVREVAWTTFGGLYIRRQVINDVGDFDPHFEWTYNRDVDYCLSAREKGWKIYQIPVCLTHFEAKDNKRLRGSNSELNAKEARNLERLKQKWKDSPLIIEKVTKIINND